jgi:hypothetical protein
MAQNTPRNLSESSLDYKLAATHDSRLTSTLSLCIILNAPTTSTPNLIDRQLVTGNWSIARLMSKLHWTKKKLPPAPLQLWVLKMERDFTKEVRLSFILSLSGLIIYRPSPSPFALALRLGPSHCYFICIGHPHPSRFR